MILTFNEESNIGNCLKNLGCFKKVWIVDSFSTDKTIEIAQQYPNVEVISRRFDHFADQCNFGLSHIESPWTLSLDADYIVSPEFIDELKALQPSVSGYMAGFTYCVYGKRLRAALYPPRTVFYRTHSAIYRRDGHAHRVHIDGDVAELKTKLDHDDRKSLSVWCDAQRKYAIAEADKLSLDGVHLGWKDRLRRSIVFAPLIVALYCLFIKLLVLDGLHGVFYTYQRVFAEVSLSLELLDRRIRKISVRDNSRV